MLISLVVPCYNEEESLPIFYKEASKIAQQMGISHGADFEFIFVDDGSKDRTLQIARELHRKDARVRYISFSRNFGKEAGIYAGLKAAKGDYVATMDADLQDPPSLLPEMLELLLSGEYDCAATRRTTREGEPPVRSWFAKKFYQIINKLSDTEIVDGARDFRLMSRPALEALSQFGEVNLFLRGIVPMVGFRSGIVEYERRERFAGASKYPLGKMVSFAFDGITSFSTMPIRLITLAGFGIFVVSLLALLIFLVQKLLGYTVQGWATLMGSIWLMGGLQLLALGVLGEYIGKIYMEVKHRPRFVIEQVLDDSPAGAERPADRDSWK